MKFKLKYCFDTYDGPHLLPNPQAVKEAKPIEDMSLDEFIRNMDMTRRALAVFSRKYL